MKRISEMIGDETYARLKERYGVLVDNIFVEEGVNSQIVKMGFEVVDYKSRSVEPSELEIGNVLGQSVAEIEQALYKVLNFSGGNDKQGIHFNNDLSKTGIYMHRDVYKVLMKYELDPMQRIEERLNAQKAGT